MGATALLDRITVDARLLGGRPAIRGHRLAVEHLMDMMLAGDAISDILAAYPWLELADLHACLAYTGRSVANERLHPFALQGQGNEASHRLDDIGPRD